MILNTGAKPPLHRRFNGRLSMLHIRNRYEMLRLKIANQVKVLQKDKRFCDKCGEYYSKGYKDWIILSAIFNCMLNWRSSELGIGFSLQEEQKLRREVHHILSDVVYPPDRFLGRDMNFHIKMHSITVLVTYGFELRRLDIRPDVVEKFLRERMMHFDFDLKHTPLFGEPRGDWPES